MGIAIRRLLLVVGSALFGLLLCEGICRLLPLEQWDDHIFDTPEGKAVTQFQLVPGRGYEMIPNTPPDINNLGMRGVDRTQEKPEGCFRVLVIGDSVAFGHGVEVEETFASQLETKLCDAYPGRCIEVLNGGTSGYNTTQELHYLEGKGLSLDPDLVILAYCPNDTIVTPIIFKKDGRYVFYQPDAGAPELYNAFLIRNSAFYRMLMFAWETHKSRADGEARKNAGFAGKTGYDREGNLASLGEMCDLLSERKIPMVGIIFPFLERPFLEYTPRLRAIHADARQALRDKNVDAIDLFNAWSKRNYLDFKRANSSDYVHPNARGHRDAAARLFDWVKEKGYLDSVAPTPRSE